MSAFVWLDYSERERWKVLDIVDLCREHDLRDELGRGVGERRLRRHALPGYKHDHDTRALLSSRISEPEKTAGQISGDSDAGAPGGAEPCCTNRAVRR